MSNHTGRCSCQRGPLRTRASVRGTCSAGTGEECFWGALDGFGGRVKWETSEAPRRSPLSSRVPCPFCVLNGGAAKCGACWEGASSAGGSPWRVGGVSSQRRSEQVTADGAHTGHRGARCYVFLTKTDFGNYCRYIGSCRSLCPVPPLMTDCGIKTRKWRWCHPRLIQAPHVLRVHVCVWGARAWGCSCVHARACVCGGPRGCSVHPSQVRCLTLADGLGTECSVTHAPSGPRYSPSPGTRARGCSQGLASARARVLSEGHRAAPWGGWHVRVEFLEKPPSAFLSGCCFPKPPRRRARPSARVATARGTSPLALQASVPALGLGGDSPLSGPGPRTALASAGDVGLASMTRNCRQLVLGGFLASWQVGCPAGSPFAVPWSALPVCDVLVFLQELFGHRLGQRGTGRHCLVGLQAGPRGCLRLERAPGSWLRRKDGRRVGS